MSARVKIAGQVALVLLFTLLLAFKASEISVLFHGRPSSPRDFALLCLLVVAFFVIALAGELWLEDEHNLRRRLAIAIWAFTIGLVLYSAVAENRDLVAAQMQKEVARQQFLDVTKYVTQRATNILNSAQLDRDRRDRTLTGQRIRAEFESYQRTFGARKSLNSSVVTDRKIRSLRAGQDKLNTTIKLARDLIPTDVDLSVSPEALNEQSKKLLRLLRAVEIRVGGPFQQRAKPFVFDKIDPSFIDILGWSLHHPTERVVEPFGRIVYLSFWLSIFAHLLGGILHSVRDSKRSKVLSIADGRARRAS